MTFERYGEGWQERHKVALSASRNPVPAYRGGGGFMHVPGQTGMYADYLERGGPPGGIGTANIMAGGRMAAYRAGVRIAGSPLRAPITYTSIRGGPAVFVPTESLRGGEQFMPLAGSPAPSFGSAATGLAAGGSALARGGPAVGTLPGAGIGVAAAGGGGGLTAAPAAGLGLGGIGDSITSAGTGAINTVKEYIPLAIKIGVAIIGIKMILWLVRKK